MVTFKVWRYEPESSYGSKVLQECKRQWYTDLSTTHSKNKFTWFNYFITFKINDKSSYYTLCRSWCVHSKLYGPS